MAKLNLRRRAPSGRYSRALTEEYSPTQRKRYALWGENAKARYRERLRRHRNGHRLNDRDMERVVMREMLDEKYHTSIGRLHMDGLITDVEYRAGDEWAVLMAKYRALACGPVEARSGEMERQGVAEVVDPDSPLGQEQAERDRKVIDRAARAHECLIMAGLVPLRLIRGVCEYRETVQNDDLPVLQVGLRALAQHWRLT